MNSITYTDPTHLTLNLDTTGAITGAKNVTVTNPDGQALTGNGILTVGNPLVLTGAASRLTHQNGGGDFDIVLPLSGTAGVEPRNGNGSYLLVLTFDHPISAGSATVTSGTGTAGAITFSGNEMRIPLTGVTDQQETTVTATNVSGPGTITLASTVVKVGFLIGDANTDRMINSGDAIVTRNRSSAALDANTCKSDVNLDGLINTGDTIIVRNRAGNALP